MSKVAWDMCAWHRELIRASRCRDVHGTVVHSTENIVLGSMICEGSQVSVCPWDSRAWHGKHGPRFIGMSEGRKVSARPWNGRVRHG